MEYTVYFTEGRSVYVDDTPCFGGMQGGMPCSGWDDPEISSEFAISCTFHVHEILDHDTVEDGVDLELKVSQIIKEHKDKLLPQFFSGCTYEFDSSGYIEDFTAPMGENLIQSTMFALRSIRNLFSDTGAMRLFVRCFEETKDISLSFLVSQIWREGKGYGNNRSLYLNNDSDEGVIDYYRVTVEDFQHLLSGEVGYDFQGKWTESDSGYGSYGCMGDGEDSPYFSRTHSNANLWSNSLKPILHDSDSQKLESYHRSKLESMGVSVGDQLQALLRILVG